MNDFGRTLEGSFHYFLHKYIKVVHRRFSTLPSILGFTFTIMLLNKNMMRINGHLCSIIHSDQAFKADCSFRNLTDVPQDLNEKIEDLDLSYNDIVNLNDYSFAKYKNLKKLNFSHNGDPVEQDGFAIEVLNYSPNCFSIISSLEELDVTYINFGRAFILEWPKTLIKLRVENGYHVSLNLIELANLKELYACGNELGKFPELNLQTPLQILDLSKNKDLLIYPEYISPFCLLRIFYFDARRIYQENNYCNCERLKQWMMSLTIHGTRLVCGKERKNCQDPDITPQMWGEYNKCMSLHPKGFMKTLVLLIALFFVIFFSIIVVIFLTKTEDDEDWDEEEEEVEEEEYYEEYYEEYEESKNKSKRSEQTELQEAEYFQSEHTEIETE